MKSLLTNLVNQPEVLIGAHKQLVLVQENSLHGINYLMQILRRSSTNLTEALQEILRCSEEIRECNDLAYHLITAAMLEPYLKKNPTINELRTSMVRSSLGKGSYQFKNSGPFGLELIDQERNFPVFVTIHKLTPNGFLGKKNTQRDSIFALPSFPIG